MRHEFNSIESVSEGTDKHRQQHLPLSKTHIQGSNLRLRLYDLKYANEMVLGDSSCDKMTNSSIWHHVKDQK